MSSILIIEACFYQDVATLLREGAIDVLNKQGHEYGIETVPGALEIPAALNFFYIRQEKIRCLCHFGMRHSRGNFPLRYCLQ